MENKERIVIIPGASRMVGRAIARRFATKGARLILPVYDDWPESTEEMVAEFSDSGFCFRTVRCDLTDPDEVKELFGTIAAEENGLDVLINNIERGGMPIVHGSYERPVNRDQWHVELDTTLRAKWLLFRSALPFLRERNGSVVNLSSIAGTIGRSGPASLLFNDAYSAANRAVSSFTEQWAREGAPQVRVNEVMLGLIHGRHAEGTRGWQALSETQHRAIISHILLERTGSAEEVAEVVWFFATAGHYVTGATIRIDGGYCLGSESVAPMPPGILPD